ncbi:MAG TPA: glycine cleavage system protein GcvH [Candidatus Dormibacteraeota bacterium]|jgi:glycine cleavage system H protein|nr:glycine cleavage system protein GcvH [Candidatus Dormibacteraeota bacterium]
MTTANGCDLPDDLYYFVEKHIWLRHEGEEVVMGLTDVAQHLAGKVIAVTIKKVGRSLSKGQSAATVESSKWVGPVPTPVSGEIVAANADLVADPELINRDCYGAGWVVRLKVGNWAEESVDLVTGADGLEKYQAYLTQEGIKCE